MNMQISSNFNQNLRGLMCFAESEETTPQFTVRPGMRHMTVIATLLHSETCLRKEKRGKRRRREETGG